MFQVREVMQKSTAEIYTAYIEDGYQRHDHRRSFCWLIIEDLSKNTRQFCNYPEHAVQKKIQCGAEH